MCSNNLLEVYMKKIMTYFLFTNEKAEEAINFYTSLFDDSKIESLTRHEEGSMAGTPGKVLNCIFTLKGESFMAMDSAGHTHGFTPSISLFINCDSETELDKAFAALSEGGQVLMDIGEYPFAKKFVWVQDKFGLSWQLSFGGQYSV
jgi:predicted 3-demethylubiquinone-9 3-methyltransferase (glyoxalase superfamily)